MTSEAIWLPDPDFIMQHEASETNVRNKAKLEVNYFDSSDYREHKSVVTDG